MPAEQRPLFSVIMPAFNEAAGIERHLRALLEGVPPGAAQVVVVCNGCTDGTADAARRASAPGMQIVEIETASKSLAIRAGERLVTVFPRFYVDADVCVNGSDLLLLVHELNAGEYELVSPAMAFDLAGAGWAARLVGETWLRLPHGRSSTFQAVLGISERGRRRWGEFPQYRGDDTFIAAQVPPPARRIVHEARVVVRPPGSWWGWVKVRERGLRGERELRRAGMLVPRPGGQRREALRLLLDPGRAAAALLYLAAVAAARLLAVLPRGGRAGWYRDESSRRSPVAPAPARDARL
jgi:hypothetical protein